MTARDCVRRATAAGPAYQHVVNAFIDDFRSAGRPQRTAAVVDPVELSGPIEGLVAAVVSALCRETGTPTPAWVGATSSPVPFFAFPATSYEMRVRLHDRVATAVPDPQRVRAGELPVEGMTTDAPPEAADVYFGAGCCCCGEPTVPP